jgi:hypothetical protein
MPLTVHQLLTKYGDLVAPGNEQEFGRLLLEADERLLAAGRWHWTREPITLTPDGDGLVTLPSHYESIVGCRVGDVPQGVVWQETEYLEGGPGEIAIDGCAARLVDQGWTDTLEEGGSSDEEFDDTTVRTRVYKVTGAHIDEVSALCRFSAKTQFSSDYDTTICPVSSALKQMMLAIVYEEASNTDKSIEYKTLALNSIQEHEKAYRGLANEIFKPLMFQPVRYRSRRNFA